MNAQYKQELIHATSLGLTWFEWIHRFTPEEYNDIAALSLEQPLGVNRLYYYLSLFIISQCGKKGPKLEELMFEYVPNDVKLKRWMESVGHGINRDT